MHGDRRIAKENHLPAFLFLVALALAAGSPAFAAGGWSLGLEAVYISVNGYDQHVLTVTNGDLGATLATESRTAVLLETISKISSAGATATYIPKRWS